MKCPICESGTVATPKFCMACGVSVACVAEQFQKSDRAVCQECGVVLAWPRCDACGVVVSPGLRSPEAQWLIGLTRRDVAWRVDMSRGLEDSLRRTLPQPPDGIELRVFFKPQGGVITHWAHHLFLWCPDTPVLLEAQLDIRDGADEERSTFRFKHRILWGLWDVEYATYAPEDWEPRRHFEDPVGFARVINQHGECIDTIGAPSGRPITQAERDER